MPNYLVKTFKGMKEVSLYEALCNSYVRGKTIVLKDRQFKSVPQKTAETYRRIIEGVNFSISSSTLSNHDQKMISDANGPEIRSRILYALGFRPNEGDTILRNLKPITRFNPDYGVYLMDIFSRGSSENSIGRIKDITVATYVSAFLETPISVLLSEQVLGPAPAKEACWYHHLTYSLELSDTRLPSDNRIMMVPFIDGIPAVRRTYNRKAPNKGMSIGKYFIPDLNCFVGLTVVFLPEFVQISIFADEPVHVIKSLWPNRLAEIGSEIGITGPKVYTVSSQFLSDSAIQIHRMNWLLGDSPQALLRLFTRIFSPRTAEASIWDETNLNTFTYPSKSRHAVISKLKEYGIIKHN